MILTQWLAWLHINKVWCDLHRQCLRTWHICYTNPSFTPWHNTNLNAIIWLAAIKTILSFIIKIQKTNLNIWLSLWLRFERKYEVILIKNLMQKNLIKNNSSQKCILLLLHLIFYIFFTVWIITLKCVLRHDIYLIGMLITVLLCLGQYM